jgi:Anti-repressor SinI
MFIYLSIKYKNMNRLEVFVVKNIDTEWLSLILQAKEQGISLKEIRIFFAMQESNLTKEEV